MNKNDLNRTAFFSRLIFVVATALLFFLMGLTFKHIEKVNINNSWVNHSFEVSLKLEELITKVQNLEWLKRNYLITGDKEYLSNIPNIKNAILKDLAVLENTTKDDPKYLSNIKKLKQLTHQQINLVDRSILKSNSISNTELKKIFFEGNDLRKKLLGHVHNMLAVEKKLLNERRSSLVLSQKNTPIYLYILAIFSLGLLSYVFYRIYRGVTKEYLDKQIIEEKNITLEANNKELQAFNYAASHDLQEPLRKIETFISRLKDKDYDNLSENGKNYLERILVSAGRMRNLIDDLLQFSKSTRGDQPLEMVDFNEIMTNTLEELNEKIKQKEAQITTNTLPTMKAVPFQIQQLFINLIENSLKYSKDHISPQIKIHSEKIKAEDEPLIKRKRSKYYQKIVFKDNGIGFDEEYAGKIFILFNRLHSREEYDGTGIGLAICKKIIENHNGCICAKGKVNEGAQFTLFFPIQ